MVVERLLYEEPALDNIRVNNEKDMSFYKKQKKIALRNLGVIHPERLEEYLANGGYLGLGKVLNEMTPEQVVEEIKASGLRGRGGAGFPTGVKWEAAAKNPPINGKKFVVCNADEGDPGAFMDRSLLEGDPHNVIEAIGSLWLCYSSDKVLYILRAEYPRVIEDKIAIAAAEEAGLLGENIMGSDSI